LEKDKQIEELTQRLDQKGQEIAELKARLEALEQIVKELQAALKKQRALITKSVGGQAESRSTPVSCFWVRCLVK
jgi:peptidoglycan hydrolase CwlO-like protein